MQGSNMFQLTISVDSSKADWLYSIEDIIGNKLKECNAVSALNAFGNRLYCAFGCEAEDRARMIAAIKDCLIEMYAVVTKFDYIKHNLPLSLSNFRYEMLVHTLVAFDRENERKLLRKLLHVQDGMALDGVFNFALGELKERWLEICKLTKSNGMYLHDDETFNELLRFLISAVNPKINRLTVCEYEGRYRLTGSFKNSDLDLDACDGTELMYYLIDLAPLELVIDGGISNIELKNALSVFLTQSSPWK